MGVAGYRVVFIRKPGGSTAAMLIFTGIRDDIRKSYEDEIRGVINAGLPPNARCTFVARKLDSLTVGTIASEDEERCRSIPPWLADQCDELLAGPKLWRP